MRRMGKTIVAAALLAAACSVEASAEFTYSKLIEEVVEVRDSDGNVYEVTHRLDRDKLSVTEIFENVPVELNNEIEEEITGLYIKSPDEEDWGENWIDYIDGIVSIPYGEHAYMTMDYSKNKMQIDIKLELADENEITFDTVDLNNLSGATHFEMLFYYDEEADDYGITFNV